MKSKPAKLATICLIPALVLSFLVSCTSSPESVPPSAIEVIDQIGRVVVLDEPAQRIISLAPSNTEILFALGLADRVVAVSDFCDYPPEAKTKPSIGGFSTPNIEEIVALSPNLILATDIHKEEILPALERVGLTVAVLDPKNLDDVLESFTLVGELTGQQEEASELVTDSRNRIKAITDKTDNLPEAQRPSVFYIIWHDPLMTVSSSTRIHELIVKAGGINIAQDLEGGYPTISLEAVIEANVQVIVAGSGMGEGADLPFLFASTDPRLKDIDARINNRIYEINTDLVGRPGPRIIEALEQFAELLHPELF